MALYMYTVLLLFVNYTLAKNCVFDNTQEYITWEKELMEYLDCGYNRQHAPKEATTINVTFFVRAFNLDAEEGVMTMQAWMGTKWKDERLKWDPDKHHGINETDVSNFYIWTPNFGILNSEDFLDTDVFFYRFELKSTGDVRCQHQVIQEAWCSVKLTDWPFDVQECNLEFSSRERPWLAANYTMNFHFAVLEPQSAEWHIFDYKQDNTKNYKEDGTKSLTKVTFFLMRESVGLSAIVVYPAFILTVLSILSLCLDVRRRVRLAIICFSLMGHYYFLTELAANIPNESHFPPTLLLYYRGSALLSIVIVLSTFILAAVCKLKSKPHSYVTLINDFVYENKYRTYLVYPRWDFDDVTVDRLSSSEDWVKFANIVNSVLIFCVVFAYVGLYGTKIPKRTYYEVTDDFRRLILEGEVEVEV